VGTLLETIDRNIRARGLFRRGQKILVAVSGGVDSMVLLHVLHRFSKEHKWKLTVAHLNHQLRGRSSDADERLVARTAKALRLPIAIERADVKVKAKSGGISLEMAAREARHDFLARTAIRLKIPAVALAHHADDRVELFFLRLLRGSGSEGLGGMKWRNRSPFAPERGEVVLVRPLLDQSKESLREYAVREKIKFHEDASNLSQDILRNRVRHELLPLLRGKYQPALDRIILQSMEIIGAESEVTDQAARERIAAEANVKSSRSFDEFPVAVQRRMIQLQLRHHKIAEDFGLVESLRTSPGQPLTLSPQTIVFRAANGSLHFRQPFQIESNLEELKLNLNGGLGSIAFAGKRIQWKIGRQKTFRVPPPRRRKEIFDADKVGSQIVLRHWRPGDRIHPIGMEKAVKLQDLFTNQRIPRAERHKLVVATTAQDEVFWIENLRISERFKLTKSTQRRLMWEWKMG
jgi:tRNA(Ile)-lysidine synthase